MSASDISSLSTQASPQLHGEKSPHVVQFYSDEGFLLEELGHFVGAALAAGGSAVVIATKAHEDNLARKLKARGLDLTSLIADGRLTFRWMPQKCSPDSWRTACPTPLSFQKYSVEWSRALPPRPRTSSARSLHSEKWWPSCSPRECPRPQFG